MDKFILRKEDAVLVIVDIQERLAAVMSEREKVVGNCLHLIEAAKLLRVPILLNEQYPKGLGPTVGKIRDALPSYAPLEKMTFSCCGEGTFHDRLTGSGRRQVILCGMETHVCVLQSCLGLLRDGYEVHLISDAVCSRTRENFSVGVEYMRDAGAVISSTETALFQLVVKAGTEEFKVISKRIK